MLKDLNKLCQSIPLLLFLDLAYFPNLGHPYQVPSTHLFPIGFVYQRPMKRCWLVHTSNSDQLSTITDAFTKNAEVVAVPNKQAKLYAHQLYTWI
jgi:hypothetical protein